ncbi:MAG: hypothetical protein ACD_58C00306G0009 [uncultured bacterium]|nr:MAG: hypothetical protein ACD_58C00306G0009 [uncultured bacterium]
MSEKTKVGIIFGGLSLESEVSLTSGRNLYNNINKTLFDPIAIYISRDEQFWQLPETLIIRNTTKEIEERLEAKAILIEYEKLASIIDIAFLVTHGKFGDDGSLQGLMELLHVPYTGSGVLSAALGMDKDLQRKLIGLDKDINQPEYLTVNIIDWQANQDRVINSIEQKFVYPLVSKPAREGSTIGVETINSKDEFINKVKKSFIYDNKIIIEPYLKGREFSCMVVGGDKPRALLPTETIHSNEIFTYDEKYLPGASEKITPMDIDENIIKEIQRQSLACYIILGCSDYARIDGFVLDNNKVVITDPNSAASTGLGPSSWTWHQAVKAGYSVKDFITELINISQKSQTNKKYAINTINQLI